MVESDGRPQLIYFVRLPSAPRSGSGFCLLWAPSCIEAIRAPTRAADVCALAGSSRSRPLTDPSYTSTTGTAMVHVGVRVVPDVRARGTQAGACL